MSIVVFIDDWRLEIGLAKLEPSVHHYKKSIGFFCIDLAGKNMEVA